MDELIVEDCGDETTPVKKDIPFTELTSVFKRNSSDEEEQHFELIDAKKDTSELVVKNVPTDTESSEENEEETYSKEEEKLEVASGFSGSFNEKELVAALDELFIRGTEGQKRVIGLINSLNKGQKEVAYNSLIGYFISNIIKGAGREGIDVGAKKRMEEKGSKDGVWVDVEVRGIKEVEDENSPNEYKEEIKGVVVGYDGNIESEIAKKVGVYVGYKAISAKQGEDEGEVGRGTIGIYAMGSIGKIDIKGVVEGRMDNFTTTREIISGVGVKEKSEGKFGGMGAMLEGEIEYKGIKKGIIRPYVGARIGITNTEGFKEKGESSLKLEEVKDSKYVRASMRTGVRARIEKEKAKYSVGAGIECLALGREKELKCKFDKEETERKIKSVKEGVVRGELELGLEYEVNERTGVYAKVTGGVGSYND
jgi:hypothetical protein